jgi:hypothetical protein
MTRVVLCRVVLDFLVRETENRLHKVSEEPLLTNLYISNAPKENGSSYESTSVRRIANSLLFSTTTSSVMKMPILQVCSDFETTGNEKSKQRPSVPLLQLHKISTFHSDGDDEDINHTNAIRNPKFLCSKTVSQKQPNARTKQQLQFLAFGHKFKTKN